MKTRPELVACGDHVYDARDPRHVGRVVAIWRGWKVRVRFDETAWKGEIPWRYLRYVAVR
jgi:hypothetical protein